MMGLVLDAMLEWMPTQWRELSEGRNFGVEWEALPPATAGDWYVAIDDGGVSGQGQPQDYYLHEQAQVIIGVWRRQTETPRDRIGRLMLRTDKYRPQAQSLEMIERQIVTMLHFGYGLMSKMNTTIQATTGLGDCVTMPLIYRGRSRNEAVDLPGFKSQEYQTFIGRRLKFSGLDRTQGVEVMG